MASSSLSIFNSVSASLSLVNRTSRASVQPLLPFRLPAVRFPGGLGCRNRSLEVRTRAGPSTSSLVFAFVLPLSLLVVTIFTSIKIADKLDRDFLEEVAVNRAMMEENDEEDDSPISLEEEPAVPRTRNRPKREA